MIGKVDLPMPAPISALKVEISRAEFWKKIGLRMVGWQLIALVAIPFSKQIAIGICVVGAIDLAYRILLLEPKHENKGKTVQTRALRHVACLNNAVIERYFRQIWIGYDPWAVSFDEFPKLALVPADEELFRMLEKPRLRTDFRGQHLTDSELAKHLFQAKDSLEIDLSDNPITGLALLAGVGLPVRRIIMENIKTFEPKMLRYLEVYPSLEQLDLSGSTVTDEALILGLYQIPPKIKVLRLDRCTHFKAKTLLRFVYAHIHPLECLTLIDADKIDASFVKNVMERASENRIKPLMVIWKDGQHLRMDLSACNGIQKHEQMLMEHLQLKIDHLKIYGTNFEVFIEWDEFPKTAKKVTIRGKGNFDPIAHEFLKSFEWIGSVELNGFSPIGDGVKTVLSLLADTLDIKP